MERIFMLEVPHNDQELKLTDRPYTDYEEMKYLLFKANIRFTSHIYKSDKVRTFQLTLDCRLPIAIKKKFLEYGFEAHRVVRGDYVKL